MMKAFCIDVSDTMSKKQIADAFDKVVERWKYGDRIYVFNRTTAAQISFDEAVNYSLNLEEEMIDLSMRLFKNGTRHKWQGRGATKASILAPSWALKVCVTNGMLQPGDFRCFTSLVKV